MTPTTTNPTTLLPSLLFMIGVSMRQKTSVLNSVLVDMKAARAAKGMTIDSVFEYDMEVTDVEPAENMPVYQESKFRKATMTLGSWKNVKFKYRDDFLSGNGNYQQFVPNSVFTATVTLLDYVSNVIAEQLRVTPNVNVGTTVPLGTYSELVELNELISANAPSVMRSALFGRKTEAALFNQAQMTTQDYHAPAGVIRQGSLPNTLGYDLIAYQPNMGCTTSQGVNEIAGDITFVLPTNMEPHATYEVVATVDAANAGKFFYPGNILMDQLPAVKDNTASIVIHNTAEVVGTTATIKISVSECFYNLAGGVGITALMLNILDDAFAYQKFGVGVANRPSSHIGSGIRSMHLDDVINNLAYGLTFLEGYYLMLLSLDILFGTAILMPEYTARAVQVSALNNGYVA